MLRRFVLWHGLYACCVVRDLYYGQCSACIVHLSYEQYPQARLALFILYCILFPSLHKRHIISSQVREIGLPRLSILAAHLTLVFYNMLYAFFHTTSYGSHPVTIERYMLTLGAWQCSLSPSVSAAVCMWELVVVERGYVDGFWRALHADIKLLSM